MVLLYLFYTKFQMYLCFCALYLRGIKNIIKRITLIYRRQPALRLLCPSLAALISEPCGLTFFGVPQTPEMALAEAKKLFRFNTTQASRPMRADRIHDTRHPNLRQHAVLRSKNRTNHVLPKPDISCARDTKSIKQVALQKIIWYTK